MPELVALRDYLAGSRGGAIQSVVPSTARAGVAPPSGPDDLALAQRTLAQGGSGASLIARLLNDPTFAAVGRTAGGVAQLARIPSILDSSRTDVGKATGVAGAVTGAASQFSRIPAVASAFQAATSALNSGVTIGTNAAGGAAQVPYLSAVASGLNIADIAQSNRPDDQKVYDSVHQVGRLVADAYLPVVGGFAADMVSGGVRHLLFPPSHYDEARKADLSRVGPAMRALLTSIDTATTRDELDAAASVSAAGARGEVGGRGVALRGAHLDTSGQETVLSEAYTARKALIEAAQANPSGPEAQHLAQIDARVRPLKDASTTLARLLATKNYGDPQAPQILANALLPPGMEGSVDDTALRVLTTLDDWTANLARFHAEDQGRTPVTASHVASQYQNTRDLVQAAQVLGLDLDAARTRLDAQRRAEQLQLTDAINSVGGE